MKRSVRIGVAVSGALIAVGILEAAGSAGTADRDDPGDRDVPITGDALDTASAAALAHIGEGRVTETEIEDEDSYYEVEVTLDDGSQVDVQLDEAFNVVGTEHENGSD